MLLVCQLWRHCSWNSCGGSCGAGRWLRQTRVSLLTDLATISVFMFVNRIGGVMVSVLALSVVGRGFKPRSGQTKDYAIGICCFSAKHTVLMRKSKDWLACNQDNVSEWVNMSIHGLLFQWSSTIKMKTKSVDLVQSGLHHHLIENILFSPWYSWKIAELVLRQQSLNHSLNCE